MSDTGSIRTVIVDDEPLARRSLRNLLKASSEFVVIAECRNGAEAVAQLQKSPCDLLLLDIQMPEMNGFEALVRLPRPLPVIIFVTAYDNFAIRAFEVQAVDYLLKPVERARFQEALARAKSVIQTRDFAGLAAKMDALLTMRSQAAPVDFARRLPVKQGPKIVLIEVDQIDFIEANDYYAMIHVGAKSHLVRQSLNELESTLDPTTFLRIHRSALVNIARIRELRPRPGGGRQVLMRGGQSLPLSRLRWQTVRSRLTL